MSEAVIVLIKSDKLSYNISRNELSTIIIINVAPNMAIPFDELTSVLAAHQSCEIHWNFVEVPEITKKFQSMIGKNVPAPVLSNFYESRPDSVEIRARQVMDHMSNNGAHPDFWTRNVRIQKKCQNYILSCLGEPINPEELTKIYEYVRNNYE